MLPRYRWTSETREAFLLWAVIVPMFVALMLPTPFQVVLVPVALMALWITRGPAAPAE